MSSFGLGAILAITAAAGTASAAGAPACEVAAVTSSAKLQELLSKRAVEVVKRAAAPGWSSDRRLVELVAGDAPASLGAGDVGRPFGVGPPAVHAMAAAMHADTYRFLRWDFMDGRADPCGEQKVSVEFSATATQDVSKVEFTFRNGRVINASGWQRSYSAGSLK
jgi:hypothetical protein